MLVGKHETQTYGNDRNSFWKLILNRGGREGTRNGYEGKWEVRSKTADEQIGVEQTRSVGAVRRRLREEGGGAAAAV